MSKFQYVLGWLAAVGVPLWIAVFVILSITGESGWQYVLPKTIWMPFVFLWGLKQIRTYRYERLIEKAKKNAEWPKKNVVITEKTKGVNHV